jgi:hypothetical protein
MRRVAVAMSLSSSGEWTAPSPRNGARKSLRTSEAEVFISLTMGRVMRMKTSIGPATARRDALGTLEGEGFGDEFAEQDFEVGDEREGEEDRDGVGVEDCVLWETYGANCRRRFEDDLRDGGFADPAEGEACDRDAELDGGKKLVDGVLELEGGAGARDGRWR